MPREICNQCLRPLNVCLCEHLVKLQAPCDVLILQHPSEQKQPLATVPILQLCLWPIKILVGEKFSNHEAVKALLKKPSCCRVIFPGDNSQTWKVGETADNAEEVDTLIILDGTWRKAKKIWHLNPWLKLISCVTLSDVPKSQYQIRSSSIEGGVSTLEAVVFACNYLSGSDEFDLLNKPFKAMIDMQIKKMGPEIFKAHYDGSNS